MSWHLQGCVPSACQADTTSPSTGFWRVIDLLSKTRKWGPSREAKRDLPTIWQRPGQWVRLWMRGKMLKGKECLSPLLLQEAARLYLNTSFTLHWPWLGGRDWPAVHLACFSLFLAIHLYYDSQPPLQWVRYNHVTEFQSMSLLPRAAT